MEGQTREKRRAACKKETFDLHRWIEQQDEEVVEEELYHGANVVVAAAVEDNQEVMVMVVVPCKDDNLCPGYSQLHSCKRINVE